MNNRLRLQALRTRYHDQFPNRGALRDAVDYVFEAPYPTATREFDATGRSRQAVYDAIDALEAEGILSEISGSERYRVYEAPEIPAVVASP